MDKEVVEIDTTMVGWRAKLAEAEGTEFLRAKLVPTRQGDFTYGLDWERTHSAIEA